MTTHLIVRGRERDGEREEKTNKIKFFNTIRIQEQMQGTFDKIFQTWKKILLKQKKNLVQLRMVLKREKKIQIK